MNGRNLRWSALLLTILWCAVVAYIWSPKHYWPDADGYLLHVAEGRWVAHPPGYAFFVVSGRLFHALGFAPYLAVQLASLSLTVAGLSVLYRLMRQILSPLYAQVLTAAAAFSWLTLLNVQTGTSHASDLFTVSLLLLAAVKLPASRAIAYGADLFFATSLFLCAGFRLTTLLMMAPLFLLVAWNSRERASFWICCVSALAAAVLWQLWVIEQSGGYVAYSAAAAGMNADNRPSSLLLSGLTHTTAFNMLRALLWAGVGAFAFLIVAVASWIWPNATVDRRPFFYGLAALLGPLLGVTFYLCTHPGYVVSVIPGAALVAASLAANSRQSFPWRAFGASVIGVFCMFLFMKPFMPPATKWQAVSNGILLQYSATCARTATFNTTARWLRLAGLESEIPDHRVIDLQQEDEWREYFNTANPARRKSEE
jgi:hypothetical protein